MLSPTGRCGLIRACAQSLPPPERQRLDPSRPPRALADRPDRHRRRAARRRQFRSAPLEPAGPLTAKTASQIPSTLSAPSAFNGYSTDRFTIPREWPQRGTKTQTLRASVPRAYRRPSELKPFATLCAFSWPILSRSGFTLDSIPTWRPVGCALARNEGITSPAGLPFPAARLFSRHGPAKQRGRSLHLLHPPAPS